MNSDIRIGLRISVVARLQRTRFDMRARSMGMTLAQWRTIHAISMEPGVPQRRIAEMIDVGDVTAGRLIDRLVDKGWIERRPDPCDRRAHHVFLTDAAAPVLEQLAELGADEQRLALAGLSAQEKAQLVDLLGRVTDNLERLAGRSCGDACDRDA